VCAIFSKHLSSSINFASCIHESRTIFVSRFDSAYSPITSFSVSFFFPLMNDTGTRNTVLWRAAPRGEAVDGRQCCNDDELASLRYHSGRVRLYHDWFAKFLDNGRTGDVGRRRTGGRKKTVASRMQRGRNRRAVSTVSEASPASAARIKA